MKSFIIILVLVLLIPLSSWAATTIPFTITASEAVIVTGTPRIVVDVGGVTRYATYTSGTGTSSLAFTYTMVEGDVDLDGVTLTSPMQLNSGTIKDLNGNDATLTFIVPNTSNVKVNYPSLGMDFVADADGRYTLNGTAYNDLTSFLGAAGGSFARASTATYYDSTGTLQTAASGVPRFDYNPVAHTPRGFLVEGSRTNLLTYSDQFENAAWNNAAEGLTIVANATTAPDGTLTADKLVENSANSLHRRGQNIAATAGSARRFSIYAKAAGRTLARGWSWAGGDTGQQSFNLGSVIATGTLNPSIESVGNGWYRCSFDVPSANNQTVVFGPSDGTGSTSPYIGDGVSGIYVWGGQMEVGSFSTSYIPTVGATMTRQADVFYVGTTAPSQGTFFTEYMPYTTPATHTVMAYTNSAGNYNAGYGQLLRADAPNGTTGGNCCGVNAAGAFSANVTSKIAGSYNTIGNRAAVSLNGSAVGVITNNDFTGIGTARLHLGALNSGGTQQSYGYIRKAKVYPAMVSDTQLQLMSQ